MATPEEIAQIVMAAMQVMKEQEDVKASKRVQASQITKCLRAVVDHQGEFDGNNMTKYLKVYRREVILHDLDEENAVLRFPTLVELEIKKIVEAHTNEAKGEHIDAKRT
ncbi:unnamed protein product [Calypogeia fissa]